jgi:asparagine synthase (glutamine-hydrolysing)
VLASGCVQRQLSSEAITSYLLFGSVGEPLTLVDGVFSLPPGYSMRVSTTRPARASQPKSYAFAGLFESIANGERDGKNSSRQIADPAQKVRSLLESAVKSHLVADVPVGVFLSSGLDSTAIAALAARAQHGIHTFTVAFPDLEFSEAEMARRTAKTLGTEHAELTLSGEDMVTRLDEAIDAFDQPSMDGVNTYFVSWAARQAGLKVALSGLGSDELFGGYTSFRATRAVAKLAGCAGLSMISSRRTTAASWICSTIRLSNP